jgi:hypothetical protein
LRTAQANSSRDPIPKITRAKWTEVVAQVVEWTICKHEVVDSNAGSNNKINKEK